MDADRRLAGDAGDAGDGVVQRTIIQRQPVLVRLGLARLARDAAARFGAFGASQGRFRKRARRPVEGAAPSSARRARQQCPIDGRDVPSTDAGEGARESDHVAWEAGDRDGRRAAAARRCV